MDRLDKIFELQASFDESVQNRAPFNEWSKEDRVVALLGHLIQESYETRNTLGVVITGERKWWKKHTLSAEKWRSVNEELIDCLHFLVSAMISAGLTPQTVIEAYEKKNLINRKRQAESY
ncbi:MAG: dUTPase [Halobacteriota archaeon]|jgi:dimeric dUTPase (all-alpha-NTP-PPase superfamily)